MYELISIWESTDENGEFESGELAKSQLSGAYMVWLSRKGRNSTTDRSQFKTVSAALLYLKEKNMSKLYMTAYNSKHPF